MLSVDNVCYYISTFPGACFQFSQYDLFGPDDLL